MHKEILFEEKWYLTWKEVELNVPNDQCLLIVWIYAVDALKIFVLLRNFGSELRKSKNCVTQELVFSSSFKSLLSKGLTSEHGLLRNNRQYKKKSPIQCHCYSYLKIGGIFKTIWIYAHAMAQTKPKSFIIHQDYDNEKQNFRKFV